MPDEELELEFEAPACFSRFILLHRTSAQAPSLSSNLSRLEWSAGSFSYVAHITVSEVRVEDVAAGHSSLYESLTKSQRKRKPKITAQNTTLTTGDELSQDRRTSA